jgi:hypothetical protein
MWDVMRNVVPADAEIVRDEAVSDADGRGGGRKVALARGHIYLELLTCARCRRQLGWAFVGDLARLSDDDLRLAQERTGLPRNPLLRSPDAWRRALRR